MKKVLLGVIMAAIFGLGMLIGTTTLADAVSTDKTTKKLTMIAKQLSNIDKRLEQVLVGVGTNLDPPTITALQQIKSTAQTIVTRVDQKLPPPVPTPPPTDLPP
ncbi:MAG: hypothetical protein ACRD9Q_08275 [Nitrososphaeraceae archaeon]